jgi:hypothetical protein
MEKITISGTMSSASQLFAGKYYKEAFSLTPYQQSLYNKCTRGFDAYSYQELKNMSVQERRDIMTKYSKTKEVLNTMKQFAITNTVSTLFNKLFPDARGTGLSLLMFPTKDKFFRAEMSLKDLGVTRTAIIKRLIAEEILPNNFLNKAA